MKILYFITRGDVIGGASVHLLDLVRGFKSKGHDVHIAVGGKGVFTDMLFNEFDNVHELSYLCRNINILKDVKAYFEIKKLISNIKPDVVHFHSAKAGFLGRLASSELNVPSVYTVHGWPFTDGVTKLKSEIYKSLEKNMMKKSDAIITVSNFDKALAETHEFQPLNIIYPIHNGVRKAELSHLKNKSSELKIIMVARFDHQKNQLALIDALNVIKNENWVLEFIGDGELLSKSKEKVFDYNLDHKIRFSGSCNDVYARLNKSDLFVLITNWEGFPLTIIEAMSCSLPVIATDVGGISESVESNVNGFLVNNSPLSIADKISLYIKDREVLAQHGQRGYELFNNKFTVNQMLEKTNLIYEKVLNK